MMLHPKALYLLTVNSQGAHFPMYICALTNGARCAYIGHAFGNVHDLLLNSLQSPGYSTRLLVRRREGKLALLRTQNCDGKRS